MARKLNDKMKRKGLLTRKEIDDEGDGGGDAGSDYEVREDGVELTGGGVIRKTTGTWATVHDEAPTQA